MPVSRPTANCIWKSFQNSEKKHIILTGHRGIGKTTLLHSLFPTQQAGLTTWAVPQTGVYLKNNQTGETVQVGRFNPDQPGTENRMQPIWGAFRDKGTCFLKSLLNSSSKWITIDEIGYLETQDHCYQNAILDLLKYKQVLMVIRKQDLSFLNELKSRSDAFVVDLDQPYGNAGCIIMASGQGKRFGKNKLLESFQGKPLIQWALDVTNNLFSRRLVVTVHKEIEQVCFIIFHSETTWYGLVWKRSEELLIAVFLFLPISLFSLRNPSAHCFCVPKIIRILYGDSAMVIFLDPPSFFRPPFLRI